jgi:hypothetical protein
LACFGFFLLFLGLPFIFSDFDFCIKFSSFGSFVSRFRYFPAVCRDCLALCFYCLLDCFCVPLPCYYLLFLFFVSFSCW